MRILAALFIKTAIFCQALLTERLVTPLQINHYLTRSLEQAHRFGEKPITAEIVETAMAPDINMLEPTLMRHGYNTKALCELFNVRLPEVRAYLRGQLPADRTKILNNRYLEKVSPYDGLLSINLSRN